MQGFFLVLQRFNILRSLTASGSSLKTCHTVYLLGLNYCLSLCASTTAIEPGVMLLHCSRIFLEDVRTQSEAAKNAGKLALISVSAHFSEYTLASCLFFLITTEHLIISGIDALSVDIQQHPRAKCI